jgi:hypothetical protein
LDQRDEFRHPGAKPGTHVRLMDVARGREGRLAIRQDPQEWRLVRHQRPDMLRVPCHQRQRVHRPAAGGEQVDRAGIERLDEPMQVVRMLLGRRWAGRICLFAPLHATGVVGDDGAVRKVTGERAESRGTHR